MGERGPIPKRKDSLNGHRSKDEIWGDTVTRAPGAQKVRVPAADRDWHPIAKRMWAALKKSGQSAFYEPSDWAFAYSLMDDLTYYKKSGKRSGQMLTAIYSAMTTLLVTEGDRRRVALELQRASGAPAESSNVEDMQVWKERLRS
ncbi:hypothetical protein ACFWHR_03940 [Leucobacter sp. NPDC058333]|uniref:phage terminase small subunit n=1 Tax=Leucobacter sp. NPDC058333 TaxID=3346450 RepID=UPI00365D0399